MDDKKVTLHAGPEMSSYNEKKRTPSMRRGVTRRWGRKDGWHRMMAVLAACPDRTGKAHGTIASGLAARMDSNLARALNMALIRNSAAAPIEQEGRIAPSVTKNAEAQRRKARTLAKQQQIAERVAATTGQLVSAINEAASAAEELKRASDQIAVGAEEASGAAQESLVAFQQVTAAIARQVENAAASQTKGDLSQVVIARTIGEITALINNVTVASHRQVASVAMVGELEKQAANIGDIVKAVGRIADQTNLLALNAAIEAAHAGQHGKGFAVVAEEVRTLAETSEKSATQIQNLIATIQSDVETIAAGINASAKAVDEQVSRGTRITQQLAQIETDTTDVVKGIREIAAGAVQSNIAAQQAMQGMQGIAAAAAQQSSAAEESAKTVAEQSQALAECEQTAETMSEIADVLRSSSDVSKSAEEVASAAEQLSSSVHEISRSGTQIMTAIEEIRKGAEIQSAGTEQASAAAAQIEAGLEISRTRASVGGEKVAAIKALLAVNKSAVEEMLSGIAASAEATRESIHQIRSLEQVSRNIGKIVDAISTVAIQTNMLAVNGAVEAARAGEYGRGFVVVSTDIRSLAHDSAENADRIKDMVKGVENQIDAVGQDLTEIVRAAVDEVEKARGCSESLTAIERDVVAIEEGTQEILTAATEIGTAIAQVKVAVLQISAAAQQADKSATEAATAAQQQSEGANELASGIEEIAALADELQSVA